jgi:hypothetical protein
VKERRAVAVVLLALAGIASARADEIPLGFAGPLERDLPAPWRAIAFPSIDRATSYTVAIESSRVVIRAVAEGSASFVIRRAPEGLSAERTPLLRWRWRVDKAERTGDGRTKGADDFAARIWVGFETDWSQEGWLARREAAKARDRYGFEPPGYWLHYVWAANRQHEEAFDEPYQPDHVKCVCLRSTGSDALATWFSERREPARDFERCFHRAAPRVTAVAIMTDADDAKGAATALYSDLAFVSSDCPER